MTNQDITLLLLSLREGRREALQQLFPIVYQELRRIARRTVASWGKEDTLGATAVIHETYLKLFDQTRVTVNDRKHFFALAATAMRQIVVDHARRRAALKRGGGLERVPWEDAAVTVDDRTDVMALDQALQRLGALAPRLERVVELRFFGGFSVDEAAEILEVDARTVKRDWRKARALLYQELFPGASDSR